MLFTETEIFTQDVKLLLDDVQYHEFQVFLATQPDHGDVIPNTGAYVRAVGLQEAKGSGVV